MTNERFFYHSFPRPRDGVNADKKGLSILESIVERGLLLAPETFDFSEQRSDGTQKRYGIVQKRISFTELAPSELREHAMRFGPFAIEWDINVLRKMGAIPVFYFPTDSDGVAASLVARMSEVQEVLSRLKQLGDFVITRHPSEAMRLDVDGRVFVPHSISAGGTADLIRWLQFNMEPIPALIGSIKALSGVFYPADDLRHNDILSYYRQREWRIIGDVIAKGIPMFDLPTASDLDYLRTLDPVFFGREMTFPFGKSSRSEHCQIFRRFKGQPIHETFRRVIVPSAVLETARAALSGRLGTVPIVTMDSML